MTDKNPLNERIEQALRQQEALEKVERRLEQTDPIARTKRDAVALQRFWTQVMLGGHWVYRNVVRTPAHGLGWMGKHAFAAYRRLWNRVVYRTVDDQYRQFSKTRAGGMVLGTVAFFFCFYSIMGVLWDGALYASTVEHQEVMYLTAAEEIDAEGNVHSVRGCASLPCSDEESVYFRVTPSAFNELWSLTTTGGFFYPDYVSAAIPPGLNRCTITSYGIRIKLLRRGFDWYPEILKATCAPVESTPSGMAPANENP